MKWFLRILLTLVLLAGWVIVGYYYVDWTLESPVRESSVMIEIKPDSSLKQIGVILKSKNLIREEWFFRYYALYRKKTNLLAGVYVIKRNESLDRILDKIAVGKQDLVKVTIPEGKTVEEVADILDKKGFSKQGFIEAANRARSPYTFELEIKKIPARKYKLEGYIFPSTYEFRRDASGEKIVSLMVGEFAKHMKVLDARNKLQGTGITVDQWITIASLIEREGRVRSELPTISGVIYNRLHKKMRLEVDAAVVYAWSLQGVKKKRLFYNDLKLNSPYNTYKISGLPPGPICNPGVEALKAALNPDKHQYIFYVTKKDGTNTHYFSKTLAEQTSNIARSKKNQNKK
jgi:UPF0755 protein